MTIIGGDFRLIHRLVMQIERILESKALCTVTEEVIKVAREQRVIGSLSTRAAGTPTEEVHHA